jgi:hypothetical protein
LQDCEKTNPLVRIRRPGSDADDQERLFALRGNASTSGYLLRSAAAIPSPQPARCGVHVFALRPRFRSIWNSALPFSLNNGFLWAGRGLSAELTVGFAAEYGPVYLVLAPQFEYSRNREFDEILPARSPDHIFLPYWQTGRYLIDAPLRPAYISIHGAELGQSTVAVRAGPLVVGATTADEWWGPGVRNALLLSNNAPGIPRVFLSSLRPIATSLGNLEFRWFAGELRGSGYFGPDAATISSPDLRALSAIGLTLDIAHVPGLTLGLARSVYAPIDSGGTIVGRAADALTRWALLDTTSTEQPDFDQITSLFARWVFAAAGTEIYGEWARHELPHSLMDLLRYPSYGRGYTLGLQWSRGISDSRVVRVQTELTNLEQTLTSQLGRQPSFYVGRSSPAGYTNRGRVIGAAIGPGSSSQWLAIDLFSDRARVGIFGERIRWNDDAYMSVPSPWPFLGHDVSMRGGVRGGGTIAGWNVATEFGYEHRMNYLFQNWAKSWEASATDAVNVSNWSLRFEVAPALGQAAAAPAIPAPHQ